MRVMILLRPMGPGASESRLLLRTRGYTRHAGRLAQRAEEIDHEWTLRVAKHALERLLGLTVEVDRKTVRIGTGKEFYAEVLTTPYLPLELLDEEET